mgnify:CR=1 FL=1
MFLMAIAALYIFQRHRFWSLDFAAETSHANNLVAITPGSPAPQRGMSSLHALRAALGRGAPSGNPKPSYHDLPIHQTLVIL